MLKEIKAALGLDENATVADMRNRFDRVIEVELRKEREREAGDPQGELCDLAERRMAEKKIPFVQALDEVRAENRSLSEAVEDSYRNSYRG